MQGEKGKFREKISFQLIATVIFLTAILSVSLSLGNRALDIIERNKLTDVWTILFLELERSGNELFKDLENYHEFLIRDLKQNNGPGEYFQAAFSLQNNTILKLEKGNWFGLDQIPTEEMMVPSVENWARFQLVTKNGNTFLLTKEHSTHDLFNNAELNPVLFVWRIEPSIFSKQFPTEDGTAVLYLANRHGSLIAKNSIDINENTFNSRALVQSFISSSITQGQKVFIGEEGQSKVGFFYELPNTNLIFFSESDQKVIEEKVAEVMREYLFSAIIILVIAILTLQLPLRFLLKPLKSLNKYTQEVAKGNYDASLKIFGIGEIKKLTDSFKSMTVKLQKRETEIITLLEDKAEKMRLQAELAIAGQIQDNFIPQTNLSKECPFKIGYSYTPAAEACGDWYTYFYDPETKEGVYILADVSGHGAGSAMFTAIMAGFFNYFRNENPGNFPLIEFLHKINDAIYQLGKQKWHVTMVLFRHKGNTTLEHINCGHQFPYLIQELENKKIKISKFKKPGSVIGIEKTIDPKISNLTLTKGETLMFYTDGLVEEENELGKAFGSKKLKNFLKENYKKAPQKNADALNQAWQDHINRDHGEDDCCILFLKAS